MSTIIFTKLSEENLHTDSLDEFVRHQEVKECWRKIGNEFILVPNEFVEDWNAEKCREIAQTMVDGIKENGFAYQCHLVKFKIIKLRDKSSDLSLISFISKYTPFS